MYVTMAGQGILLHPKSCNDLSLLLRDQISAHSLNWTLHSNNAVTVYLTFYHCLDKDNTKTVTELTKKQQKEQQQRE